MPRFIRSPESERRLDLHDLVTNCVDAVSDALRDAIDAGDLDAVRDFAGQLVDAAEAIEQTAT